VTDAADTLMLDTDVFNHVIDGRVDPALFRGRRLIVVGVQADEFTRCSDPGRTARLKEWFEQLAPVTVLASAFMFDVEGAGLDQAYWSQDPDRVQAMYDRLAELDRDMCLKKRRKQKDPLNQWRDVAIADTAITRGAVLVTGDRALRQVVTEFGGRATSANEL